MNRRLFNSFKNKHTVQKLGRWNTIKSNLMSEHKRKVAIKKNVDWANHDHCGGELCKVPDKLKPDSYYIPYVFG